jgi:uncharacterized protein YgiM (DUF1202 family)
MGSLKSLVMAAFAMLAAAGCSTLDAVSDRGGAASSYAAGSAMDYRLSGRDRSALEQAFILAMETGKTQSWRGAKAAGVVEPAGFALANLMDDPRMRIPAARGDLDLAQIMETELGEYVVTRNSNVRTGPGTENPIIEVLPSGTAVDVVGRVTNKTWMLIAVDGVVRGYVSQKLLVKAPGTELELAGGPQRRPILCREFRQRLVVSDERDEWKGAACNDGTGWRVAPPEIDPTTQPQNLLEF